MILRCTNQESLDIFTKRDSAFVGSEPTKHITRQSKAMTLLCSMITTVTIPASNGMTSHLGFNHRSITVTRVKATRNFQLLCCSAPWYTVLTSWQTLYKCLYSARIIRSTESHGHFARLRYINVMDNLTEWALYVVLWQTLIWSCSTAVITMIQWLNVIVCWWWTNELC